MTIEEAAKPYIDYAPSLVLQMQPIIDGLQALSGAMEESAAAFKGMSDTYLAWLESRLATLTPEERFAYETRLMRGEYPLDILADMGRD